MFCDIECFLGSIPWYPIFKLILVKPNRVTSILLKVHDGPSLR
jgi:hypothetical protein